MSNKKDYKHTFTYPVEYMDIEVRNSKGKLVYKSLREDKYFISKTLKRYGLEHVESYYMDRFTEVFKGEKYIAYIEHIYYYDADALRNHKIDDPFYEKSMEEQERRKRV